MTPIEARILTVTLNPALDVSTSVPALLPDVKLRCAAPRTDPGGGGINVARVIGRLGGTCTAFVALGGPTGARLAALMAGERLEVQEMAAPGDTRESFSVTDDRDGAQYRFVLPGPSWRGRDASTALAAIAAATPTGALIVLSGSLPPGVPADFAQRLARRLAPRKARIILDTSGAALAAAARPTPHPLEVLRMDGAEAEALAGRHLSSLADSASFARDLQGRGIARWVIVARGAEGSVMAGAEAVFHAAAAPVPVVSRIGAGDSFTAAFTLALARGRPPERALQEGMAAASAAVMTPATELCRARDARRLIAASTLTRL